MRTCDHFTAYLIGTHESNAHVSLDEVSGEINVIGMPTSDEDNDHPCRKSHESYEYGWYEARGPLIDLVLRSGRWRTHWEGDVGGREESVRR